MNKIQQISLKLSLNMDPRARIAPQRLREMWYERTVETTSRRCRHPEYFEQKRLSGQGSM